MTPDEWKRMRTYDPDYDDPYPADARQDTGKLERRLALTFVMLAGFLFGLMIWYSVRWL